MGIPTYQSARVVFIDKDEVIQRLLLVRDDSGLKCIIVECVHFLPVFAQLCNVSLQTGVRGEGAALLYLERLVFHQSYSRLALRSTN
jgi:hypothetical protein